MAQGQRVDTGAGLHPSLRERPVRTTDASTAGSRHTAGTPLNELGVDMATIMEMLRHTQISQLPGPHPEPGARPY
jgi:hypothetical protein